jgi:hypothetical protein
MEDNSIGCLAIPVPDRSQLKTYIFQLFGFGVQIFVSGAALPKLPARQFLPGGLPAVNHARPSVGGRMGQHWRRAS